MQKITYYLSTAIIFVALILTGCTGGYGATNQPPKLLGSAQAMTQGPMPAQIALLLPISGAIAPQANAIRNGFFAAYYQDKHLGTPATIKVYDTGQGNIINVYQQAIAQGANFVVGPLTKNDLSQLVNARAISVPTLALNTLDSNDSRINNLYQFGLSPLDEAAQVAKKVENDGHHRVIIISENKEWSKKVVTAFMEQWKSQGGQIIENFSFANLSDLNNGIPKLLNIDEAQYRSKSLQYVIHEKIRTVLHRRQDFDSIFLVASPDQARQVLPLLRFYYAGNVAIYATSSIYSGAPGTSTDYDLSGVIFDDMPWVLQANTQLSNNVATIRQDIRSLWPNAYHHFARFFALGVDAYQIIPNLEKLSASSQTSVIGATGQLYLLPNQHLYRQLDWAKMVDGNPMTLSP